MPPFGMKDGDGKGARNGMFLDILESSRSCRKILVACRTLRAGKASDRSAVVLAIGSLLARSRAGSWPRCDGGGLWISRVLQHLRYRRREDRTWLWEVFQGVWLPEMNDPNTLNNRSKEDSSRPCCCS
jgi:hypothetical protein